MGRRSTGERGSTDRARTAGRDWPGGAEGAVAVTRRGLSDSAADVEWRRSPRSSSDPNKGSWRGRCPAGYEVGEGTPSPHGAPPRHPRMPTREGTGRWRSALNRTDLTQQSSYEVSSTRIEPQWGLRKTRSRRSIRGASASTQRFRVACLAKGTGRTRTDFSATATIAGRYSQPLAST